MRELVRIQEREGNQVVSARELHDYVNPNTRFNDWIKRMLKYGFEKGIDYVLLKNEKNPNGGRPSTDYALTLDTAKEISMLQRNDKGKEARKYFIEVEKAAKKAHEMRSLDPLEILKQQVALMERQSRRTEALEQAVDEIRAKTETRPDYFTVVGFAMLNGVKVAFKTAQKVGKRAASICKEKGFEMDTVPDPRFGKVRQYPQDVLQTVFAELELI